MKVNFFTKFSLKNPTVIAIFMVLIVVFGTMQGFMMRTESMPNINVPVITVATYYFGASPEDIEANITSPLEKSIAAVKGVKNVTSLSNENISMIIGEFDFNRDMDKAHQEVQAAVNSTSLPEQAGEPKVSKVTFGGTPILVYSITGEDQQLEKIVVDQLEPQLEAVEGVSDVEIIGLNDNNIYIRLDSAKLKKHNLTIDAVKQALAGNNLAFPAGTAEITDKTIPIKVSNKLSSVEQLEELPIIVMPNMNAEMGDAFASLGEGMGELGKGIGQLGQGLGELGKQTGTLAQGLGTTAQGTVLTALIQQLQAEINKQLTIINNPAASAEERQRAQAALGKNQGQMAGLLTAQEKWLQKAEGSEQRAKHKPGIKMPAKPGKTDFSTAKYKEPELTTVLLKDIAEISTGKEQPQLHSRVNGSSSLIVNIRKTDEGNSIEIAKQIYGIMADFEKDTAKDAKYTKILDLATQIKTSINGLLKEGILGALFAVIVVAVFLRNVRATIVAIVSIPLSMFITLLLLPRFGITINMMSLAGMAVAVGRVVDDSIVVIENTYRRLHETKTDSQKDLFAIATQEVASAITSSTITTVAVFLPLALVSGIIGKIFAPFALTVVISILASLLVAVTVVPMLSKLLFSKATNIAEDKGGSLQEYYTRLLTWSLKKRWAIVLISVLIMGLSLGLTSKLGVQFLAQDSARNLTVKMFMTPGTKLAKTNEVAMKFEQLALELPDIELVQATVGAQNSANGFGFNTQGSDGATFLVVVKEGADIDATVERLRAKLKALETDETSFLLTTQNQSGTTENVEILVKGEDISELRTASKIIAKEIKSIPELANISNSLAEEKPEISIQVLAEKAADKGLSPVMVAGMVRGLLTDVEATTLEHNGLSQKVVLKLDEEVVSDIKKLEQLELSSMKGKVKLGEIAKISLVDGPVSISKLNGQQYASVKADVIGKNTQTTAEETMQKVEGISHKLPKNVSYELSGSSEDIKESFLQMGIAIIVAIVMVYLVMVIAFGEATSPFAILFSLPFAAAGGLLGLFVAQQPVSMSSLIGILMLIGIVVTNAIVLVDRVQQNLNKGLAVDAALIEAGKVRLRPILMTAISTIMALVPLAISSTEGALISEGLAIVVIGGLSLSTLLTLVVVPVAFSYLHQVKAKFVNAKTTTLS